MKVRIMKKLLARIILSLFGITAVILLAEGYFRVFKPQMTFSSFITAYDFRCFVRGTYYPFAFKPSANCPLHANMKQFKDTYITTNSLGLRNREVAIPKPDGVVRILFVGDSFTAGWGVDEDEVYPRLAESFLRAKFPQEKIEVVNAGLPSTGPNYYYLYLKNEITRLDPDIVVVGFWMVNDIPDNVYFSEWLQTDADGLPTKINHKTQKTDFAGNFVPVDLPLKFTVPYLRYLHLFAYVADRLFPYQSKFGNDAVISTRGCLYKRTCHDLDEAKARTKKLFWGMKKITDEKGAKLLVALLPAEFQIDRAARLKYGITVPLLPSDKDYPYEDFGGYFSENGIDYLDMRPYFQNAKTEERQFYFETDNHWNSNGHKLAAEVISEKLTEILK